MSDEPTIRQGMMLVGPLSDRDLLWTVARLRAPRKRDNAVKAVLLGWEGNEQVYSTIEVEATFPDGKVRAPFRVFEFARLQSGLADLARRMGEHFDPEDDPDELVPYAMTLVELVGSRG